MYKCCSSIKRCGSDCAGNGSVAHIEQKCMFFAKQTKLFRRNSNVMKIRKGEKYVAQECEECIQTLG